jgi:hypothetical protein
MKAAPLKLGSASHARNSSFSSYQIGILNRNEVSVSKTTTEIRKIAVDEPAYQ